MTIRMYCCVVFLLTTPAYAFDTFMGISERDTCPTAAVVQDIIDEGTALGADYTQIVAADGAAGCPDVVGYHTTDEYPQGILVHTVGGVTVGLHYRRGTP